MAFNLYENHNQFRNNFLFFNELDPHLRALSPLSYQYHFGWGRLFSFDMPGIYILTGGRQIGKSTSCKLLIRYCIENHLFPPDSIFYCPCDEIYDAHQLGQTLRAILKDMSQPHFLLIIDEITYVKNWDRVIKAL